MGLRQQALLSLAILRGTRGIVNDLQLPRDSALAHAGAWAFDTVIPRSDGRVTRIGGRQTRTHTSLRLPRNRLRTRRTRGRPPAALSPKLSQSSQGGECLDDLYALDALHRDQSLCGARPSRSGEPFARIFERIPADDRQSAQVGRTSGERSPDGSSEPQGLITILTSRLMFVAGTRATIEALPNGGASFCDELGHAPAHAACVTPRDPA
jgi:hypothetical protein